MTPTFGIEYPSLTHLTIDLINFPSVESKSEDAIVLLDETKKLNIQTYFSNAPTTKNTRDRIAS